MLERPGGSRPLALALALGLTGCAGDPPEPEAAARGFWDVMVELTEAFAADPGATVPVKELRLPEEMAGLDANGDGLVDRAELWAFDEERARQPYEGPKDRSAWSSDREGGFPLNVDPEIVAADAADLGAADIVIGVEIGGEPRAYPVNYMYGPLNEVVNDTLGGAHIAPSW